MTEETKTYTGGCHCGAVRFEVQSTPFTSAMECNCSHCSVKGLLLSFVPREQFTLIQGEDTLTEYRFNNKVIAHQFCNVCGVQPFAYGSDPEGNEMACINLRCIDDLDTDSLERQSFNGKEV